MTSTQQRRGLSPWFVIVFILLSFLAPLATAAAPPGDSPSETQSLPTETPEPCEDGLIPDGNGGCIPDSDQQPTCEDSFVLDEQGVCQPVPDLPPPPCPAGQVYDNEGNCISEPTQQPTCDQGTVLNEQTGQCDPAEQPTPPEPTTVPEVDAPLPAPDTGTINITKYSCNPVNLTASRSDLLALCVVTSGAEITATHDGGTVPGVSDTSGAITWTGVPVGSWSLQETIPPGFGDPVVYCGEEESGVSPAINGLVAGTLSAPGETIECDWFNFPIERGGSHGNRLVVVRYDCPAGTDTTLGSLELSGICSVAPGVTFSGFNGTGTRVEITDDAGAATWHPVGLRWSITEIRSIDYIDPMVFCGPLGVLDPSATPAPEGKVTGTFTVARGWITCAWFSFAEEPTPSGISLDITANTCPVGTDRVLPQADLAAVCAAMPGASFEAQRFPRVTGADGRVTWNDLPDSSGILYLRHTPAEGYLESRAFCSSASTPMAEAGLVGIPMVGIESVQLPVTSPETRYLCDWFTFPTTDAPVVDNQIVVTRVTCPGTTDYSLSKLELESLASVCPVTPGIDLTLSHAGGTGIQTTDMAGLASWSGVQRGPWSIQETLPAISDDPRVLCGQTGTIKTEHLAHGGIVEGEISLLRPGDPPENVTIECLWINFTGIETPGIEPGDVITPGSNTVEVTKYTCEPDVETGRDQAYYLGACPPSTDDIRFTLTDGLGAHPQRLSGGMVTWSNVAMGDIGIQEEIPPGFAAPVVFCNGVEYPAPTGRIGHRFAGDPDQRLTCFWFNMPGGPSTLTVHKYTCPEGYDVRAASANPRVDCPDPTNGIEFTLGLTGDSLVRYQVTGDLVLGAVAFTAIDPGNYTLTETGVPPGTGSVFAWECNGGIMGAIRPTPLMEGPSLEIAIHAGESIVCHWYNVPESESGTLTVFKYACAGEVFVSEVDCQIYEGGQDFDLLVWDGSAFVPVDSGTTGAVGVLVWTGLAPEIYQIDEPDGEWCHIEAGSVVDVGSGLEGVRVSAGEETVVKVYNCGPMPGTPGGGEPGMPGDTPTKYPNTGIPPARTSP